MAQWSATFDGVDAVIGTDIVGSETFAFTISGGSLNHTAGGANRRVNVTPGGSAPFTTEDQYVVTTILNSGTNSPAVLLRAPDADNPAGNEQGLWFECRTNGARFNIGWVNAGTVTRFFDAALAGEVGDFLFTARCDGVKRQVLVGSNEFLCCDSTNRYSTQRHGVVGGFSTHSYKDIDIGDYSGTIPEKPMPVGASKAAALAASRSPSLTFDHAPLENDIVLIFASANVTGATIATPSGWENPLGGNTVAQSDIHTLACVAHRVTSGEAAANTVTFTATNLFDANQTGDVVGCVIRFVDTTTMFAGAASASDNANTVTPHVLAGVGSGSVTATDGLVLSSVAKAGTGAYATIPTGWVTLVRSNTNMGRDLLARVARTTSGVAVASTNITPSAGDEYASITVVMKPLPTGTNASAQAASTTVAGLAGIARSSPVSASAAVTSSAPAPKASVRPPAGYATAVISASGATAVIAPRSQISNVPVAAQQPGGRTSTGPAQTATLGVTAHSPRASISRTASSAVIGLAAQQASVTSPVAHPDAAAVTTGAQQGRGSISTKPGVADVLLGVQPTRASVRAAAGRADNAVVASTPSTARGVKPQLVGITAVAAQAHGSTFAAPAAANIGGTGQNPSAGDTEATQTVWMATFNGADAILRTDLVSNDSFAFSIANDKLSLTVFGANRRVAIRPGKLAPFLTDDQFARARIQRDTGAIAFASFVLRNLGESSPAGNEEGLLFVVNTRGTYALIGTIENGTVGTLVEHTTLPDLGGDFDFEARAVGNVYKIFMNGGEVATYTDSSTAYAGNRNALIGGFQAHSYLDLVIGDYPQIPLLAQSGRVSLQAFRAMAFVRPTPQTSQLVSTALNGTAPRQFRPGNAAVSYDAERAMARVASDVPATPAGFAVGALQAEVDVGGSTTALAQFAGVTLVASSGRVRSSPRGAVASIAVASTGPAATSRPVASTAMLVVVAPSASSSLGLRASAAPVALVALNPVGRGSPRAITTQVVVVAAHQIRIFATAPSGSADVAVTARDVTGVLPPIVFGNAQNAQISYAALNVSKVVGPSPVTSVVLFAGRPAAVGSASRALTSGIAVVAPQAQVMRRWFAGAAAITAGANVGIPTIFPTAGLATLLVVSRAASGILVARSATPGNVLAAGVDADVVVAEENISAFAGAASVGTVVHDVHGDFLLVVPHEPVWGERVVLVSRGAQASRVSGRSASGPRVRGRSVSDVDRVTGRG